MSDIKAFQQVNWKEEKEFIKAIVKGKEVIIDKKKMTATIQSLFTIKGKSIDELKAKVISLLS